MAISHHTPYQLETTISAWGPKARGLIWVEGWYGVWYENSHTTDYLFIVHFFFLTSLPILYHMWSQRHVCRELQMGWYGFFAQAIKPYHPCDPLSYLFSLHKNEMCLKAMLVSYIQNKSSAKWGIIRPWQVKRCSTKTGSCIIQSSGYKLQVEIQKKKK